MKSITLKQWFILDGLGATLSAVLLGVVVVSFEAFFGIPKDVLYILASIPCFFILYDVFAFFQSPSNQVSLLKGIAFLNIAYCICSLSLILTHSSTTTLWGWLYIIGEVILLIIIASLEYTSARFIRKSLNS